MLSGCSAHSCANTRLDQLDMLGGSLGPDLVRLCQMAAAMAGSRRVMLVQTPWPLSPARAWLGDRLAEVGVEGEAVGRADGPGWWGGEVDQVAAGGLDDAGAGVSVAGVAVAVVDNQDRVA